MANLFFKYFGIYIIGLIICPFMSEWLNIDDKHRVTYIEASILTLSILFPLFTYIIYIEFENIPSLILGQFVTLACVTATIFFCSSDLRTIVYGFLTALALTWILTIMVWFDYNTDKMLLNNDEGAEDGNVNSKPDLAVRYFCHIYYFEPQAEIIAENSNPAPRPTTRHLRNNYVDTVERINPFQYYNAHI